MHQISARLLRRLFSLRNQHRSIKSLILLSKICSRCLLKSARNQINYTSERSNSSQESFVSSKSRSISDLQSIRASRLLRARKRRIREVFSSIRLRNRIASNLFSANDLRNRSFYHTKYRSFFVYLSRRYRAFCHTNCSSSLIVYFVHLFSMSFSSSVKLVAFATIFSNSTMICIDIYERFIFVKHLVMNLRSFEHSNAISKIVDLMMKKQIVFLFLFLYY